MKEMVVEEVEALTNGRKGREFQWKAWQLVRQFLETGWEAAQLLPEDFGIKEYRSSQPGYLVGVLNKQIEAVGAEKLCVAKRHKNIVMLVRTDI